MGTFDPATFLDTTLTDPNSTQSIPVDAAEYQGIVKEVEVRPWQGKKDPSKSGISLDLLWTVDDAGQRQKLGRDEVVVRQSIMIDLNEAGGIDIGKGKNVRLGRLREAVGLNTPGQPFSFRMLQGRAAKIKVEQRPDGDVIYNDVTAVTKLQ